MLCALSMNKIKMKSLILILSLFFPFGLFLSTSTSAEQSVGTTQPYIIPAIKININKTGKIIVDRKEISLENLRSKLLRLKERGGVVFYYRENPEKDPPQKALDVMRLITEIQLPVKLCTLPDCSR